MLKRVGRIPLPLHSAGGFDHADIHLETGRGFVAHTANGTIEVIDGEKLQHTTSIPGCDEASGVLCAQEENLIFAAARATGKILVIEARTLKAVKHFFVGSRPNGLAWDTQRNQLLVADVQDSKVRLLNPSSGEISATVQLSGRPRWCAYDAPRDQFLVNIKDPPAVATLAGETGEQISSISISSAGPHGLELNGKGQAYIACDAAVIIEVDLEKERELKKVHISGGPDVLWYDSKRQFVYCAIGEPGIIDIIDTIRMERAAQIRTESGAHTLTYDQRRGRLYSFFPHTACAEVYQEE